ncbi:MAG: hypothetical protein PUC66_03055 [Erysipelotrichaceae bacterium]|nr:hypothetical protein [Erysipelotrichaceae bacterium]
MKRNEGMGWLVYLLMLAGAAGVGLGILRPELSAHGTGVSMNSILVVILALIAGIILTAVLLELGHLIGAKIGRYRIDKFSVLGFQWKRKKESKKFRFSFSFSYDGITGETMMAPKDIEKSNPRHAIYFPLLFLLLEAAICVTLMVLGVSLRKENSAWQLAYIFGLVILTIALMIHLYNIFPAALDAKNDGYLITILNNQTNVIAYNALLLADEKAMFGEPAPELPVYSEVTNFTNALNQVSIYHALEEKDIEKALTINEYTIKAQNHVSKNVYQNAMAQKLSLKLLYGDFQEAKELYINLPLETKKFIANLSTAAAVRAYVLVSGLVEESENETKTALARCDKAIKSLPESVRATEEKLIIESVKRVQGKHPEWDFSDFSFKEDKPAETAEKPEDSSNEKSEGKEAKEAEENPSDHKKDEQ